MKRIAKQISDNISSHYSAGEVAALARIIATELLGISDMAYYLKEDTTLTAEQRQLLDDAIERLQKKEPIQYILGYSDFCGLRFKVTTATLIPRPETSELVEWVASESKGGEQILDIGTGSGCIAISLAKKIRGSKVTAWDISADALATAEENSASNSADVVFEEVDILNCDTCGKKFDIIVSNPPYIKEEEKKGMEANVLDWEPHTALFVPDSDPLLFYRAIAEKATDMLTDGGKLYFEINRMYGKEICSMLAGMGYTGIELRKDFADNDRMIKAILP
ncbi:MAG: peptide chain release factor N(5)-glutamine methyltransferase [Bacteroidaceae bacterium]|nr:peptide chain release factor N(5)-glutamine methyltransferase [Bacteroidaceae bacterium]